MRGNFYANLDNTIESLKKAGTYKTLQHLFSPMSNKVIVEGCDNAIVLCSNNYLGLSNKPEIINAGIEALQKYGAGAASVRHICGTFEIHRILEDKIASFLNTEASLTYTSCFDANIAVIQAILNSGDTVISDELNHASIIDGCRLTGHDVRKLVYKHANLRSLEEKLSESANSETVLMVTDGVFSMEGDIAPMPGIIDLANKYNAIVMVDDSHSTGVIGKTGKGTTEHYNMTNKPDIISGTFGKALGGAGGGFIAGKRSLIDLLIQKSRPHIFSNALPPVVAGISAAAIDYLVANPQIISSLHNKVIYMHKALKRKDLYPMLGDSAILPLIIGDTAKAIKMADEMLKKGVLIRGFGYPVVPEGKARLRIQVSDSLSYSDIDYSVQAIKDVYDHI